MDIRNVWVERATHYLLEAYVLAVVAEGYDGFRGGLAMVFSVLTFCLFLRSFGAIISIDISRSRGRNVS